MGKSHSVLYFKDKFMLKKNMNNIFSAENANNDTAEAVYKNYEVERPAKNGKYSGELRNRVIKKINE